MTIGSTRRVRRRMRRDARASSISLNRHSHAPRPKSCGRAPMDNIERTLPYSQLSAANGLSFRRSPTFREGRSVFLRKHRRLPLLSMGRCRMGGSLIRATALRGSVSRWSRSTRGAAFLVVRLPDGRRRSTRQSTIGLVTVSRQARAGPHQRLAPKCSRAPGRFALRPAVREIFCTTHRIADSALFVEERKA